MPVTNVRSHWSGGDLYFHEALSARPADLYNILTIADDAVTVGSATNDINFSWLGTTSGTFDLDAADHTLVTTGLDWTITGDIALTGNLTVDIGDVQIGDDDYLMFGDGTGGDVSARWVSATSILEWLPLTDAVGAFVIGNGTKNIDFKVWGASGAGYYLLYDESEDDLILAGVNSQLELESTVNSTTTATGSIHTLGGLGVALNSFFGGTLSVGTISAINASGPTILNEVPSATNPTLVPNRTDLTTGIGWAATEIHFVVSGVDEVQITALILAPGVTDSCALGSTSFYWSDLFLASEAVINFAADITLTHAANLLTFAGGNLRMGTTDRLEFRDATEYIYSSADGQIDIVAATTVALSGAVTADSTITATGALLPAVSGTPALGSATLMWSDLFLADTAVINFNNGNVTLTHSAALLTMVGGALTMGASGTPSGDFTLWGTTALYRVWFDVDGDTNGAWYFGDDDEGVDVGFYGQTAGDALNWDASASALVATGLTKIDIGATGTPLVLTEGTPIFEMFSTCASTDGGVSAEPGLFNSVMTGPAGVGGRYRFNMSTNVALGDWSNALKAMVTYEASGRTNGLGSAFCAEMVLSAGTTQGNYAPLESELVANSAVSSGTATGFWYGNIAGSDGAGKTTLNTNAHLFILGAGVVDTTDGLLDAITSGTPEFTHRLRIMTSEGALYIGASTSATFGD